jgi:hypothetical protein
MDYAIGCRPVAAAAATAHLAAPQLEHAQAASQLLLLLLHLTPPSLGMRKVASQLLDMLLLGTRCCCWAQAAAAGHKLLLLLLLLLTWQPFSLSTRKLPANRCRCCCWTHAAAAEHTRCCYCTWRPLRFSEP